MSINPIGSSHPAASGLPASPAAKPEAKDVPGAPDHDSDGDQAKVPSPVSPNHAAAVGQVNIKA